MASGQNHSVHSDRDFVIRDCLAVLSIVYPCKNIEYKLKYASIHQNLTCLQVIGYDVKQRK